MCSKSLPVTGEVSEFFPKSAFHDELWQMIIGGLWGVTGSRKHPILFTLRFDIRREL
jgi:hypothetical protein